MGGLGSGRKPKTLTRERAIQSLTQKLPKAIEVIAETIDGTVTDRLRYEAAVEIKNSVMGKPKATTELELGEEFDVKVLVKLLAMIEAPREYEITEGGEGAITRGSQKAISEGLNEEEEV